VCLLLATCKIIKGIFCTLLLNSLLLCAVNPGNNVAVDQVVQQLPWILLHPDGEVRSSGSHRRNHRTGTVARVTWLRIVSSAKPAFQQKQRLQGEQPATIAPLAFLDSKTDKEKCFKRQEERVLKTASDFMQSWILKYCIASWETNWLVDIKFSKISSKF